MESSAGFGVSASGVFGLLTANGSATVTATWTRAGVKSVFETPAQITVNSVTTFENLKLQLEPIVHAAVASGAVTHEDALSRQLE